MKNYKVAILLLLGASISNHPAYAYKTYPHKVFHNGEDLLIVGFSRPDQDRNVLYIRDSNGRFAQFSIDDLGLMDHAFASSNGYLWYEKSIGTLARIGAEEDGQPKPFTVFYFRNKSGHELAINLSTMQLIDLRTITDRTALREAGIRHAADLLGSNNHLDLQTAAIHLGQLRSNNHIPALEKLIAKPYDKRSDPFGEEFNMREEVHKALRLMDTRAEGR